MCTFPLYSCLCSFLSDYYTVFSDNDLTVFLLNFVRFLWSGHTLRTPDAVVNIMCFPNRFVERGIHALSLFSLFNFSLKYFHQSVSAILGTFILMPCVIK